jgi:hypothetical protein
MENTMSQENEESNPELEAEFRELIDSHTNEINSYLAQAEAALDKAIEVSEKYGVPFYANISSLSNGYVPKSFTASKFSALDRDVLGEMTEVYDSYGDIYSYGGWVHSAVC